MPSTITLSISTAFPVLFLLDFFAGVFWKLLNNVFNYFVDFVDARFDYTELDRRWLKMDFKIIGSNQQPTVIGHG